SDRVELAVEASGLAPGRYEVAAPDPAVYDVGEVRLGAGGEVVGHVLLPDGKPAAGADVRAYADLDSPSQPPDAPPRAAASARTDASGEFHLDGLEEGSYFVVALLLGKGHAGPQGATAPDAPLPGDLVAGADVAIERATAGRTTVPDLVLAPRPAPRRVALRGTVLHADGSPAPGARVLALGTGDGPAGQRFRAPVGAREGGAFSIEVEPETTVAVEGLDGNEQAVAGPIAVGHDAPPPLEVRLQPGGELRGRVSAPLDAHPGAQLALTLEPGLPLVDIPIAEDGSFGEALAPGKYHVEVIGRDGAPLLDVKAADVDVPPGGTASVLLERATTATTRVRVSGLTPAELPSASLQVRTAAGLWLPAVGLSDEGTAAVDLPEGAVIVRVVPGDGGPANSFPSPAFALERAETAAGGELAVSIPPDRGSLRGRLPGAFGAPTEVEARSKDGIRATARTRVDGRYRFPSLPTGIYRVTAPGFAPAEATVAAGEASALDLQPLR
ncbi:MAG TPA: carboxypeptidase-like regulatory domain-containing protein, partial [Planctomycetota bacterium]|nr:carboxypeptidase-like regulatory domain-containing protein [Planctomycetota bacterium]